MPFDLQSFLLGSAYTAGLFLVYDLGAILWNALWLQEK